MVQSFDRLKQSEGVGCTCEGVDPKPELKRGLRALFS